MTVKKWCEIQRQIGYLEGLSMGVDGDVGAALMDGLAVLEEMMASIGPLEVPRPGEAG